ncbi:MAG: hypothetical protein HY770_05330 [Chitinivibrionia bacterium]|nr:hypothetical protein [Chitinivibrionia bacterium]
MIKAFSRVLLLSLFVVALAAPVYATTARVNSLGGVGDYINDDSNMFRWYGVLPSYANLVMMEVGTYDGYDDVEHQAMGVTHACGEEGKWGTWALFLLQDAINDDSFFMNSPIYGAGWGYQEIGIGMPYNKLALAWGKEFEAMSIGLNFTRSDLSVENEATDPVSKSEWAFTTVGVGVRADIGDAAYTDLAATVGFGGYDVSGVATDVTLDKKMALDFAARLFYEWKDNVTLVPVIDYFQYDYALEYEGQVEPFGDKVKGFFVGGAMNIDVNTNNLLLVGAQAEYVKWEPSSAGESNEAWKMWTLPRFFIALESNVKPWLTARVGSWKALDKTTSTSDSEDDPPIAQDYKYTSADFAWFMGVGFHIAEFDIDCELANETPFNLGYWLTGYESWDSDYSGPVSRISANYHF